MASGVNATRPEAVPCNHTKDGRSRLRFDETVTVIYGTGETEIETLHVPEAASSANAEPREAAEPGDGSRESSSLSEADRSGMPGSAERSENQQNHGSFPPRGFAMHGGEAEGDDLADDLDFLDLEDLEQTWAERRESILGTRCGSPKGATDVGMVRSDAIRFTGGPRESLKWTPQPRA
ncbi:hypothetical protein CLOM_g6573 [Closterium sp. NIES-68]|nr:hypothetical protein CLOM_g6573 [Closterium sp. NIES-68]GJP71951.1 hypothetical protein CLOP_g2735 [Closterium sp. NIES-67]